jgi:KaiC/GvpD/RAD55 family RecA-like ATPase/DNA-binding transcriptional ArsR family regulator
MSIYASRYIRTLLAGKPIGRVDVAQAGQWADALEGLHDAYQLAGPRAVQMAWALLKVQRPELVRLHEYTQHIYRADQLDEIEPLRYLMDAYPIYRNAFNLIVGARGTGKSFLAVDIACKLAVQKQKVLYVAAEGAGVYDARVQAWHAERNYPKLTNDLYFYGRSVETGDPRSWGEWVALVFDQIKPSLVVIDTVARCMVGLDENNSGDMKQFVATWDTLREAGATLLFVHHSNRAGVQRGSGVLDDAADSVLFLRRLDDRVSVRNDFEGGGKNKGAKEAPTTFFKLKSVDVGPYVGDDAAACIVPCERPTMNADNPEINLSARRIMAALMGIDEGLAAGEIVKVVDDLSQSSVYRNLQELTRAGLLKKKAGMFSLTDKGGDLMKEGGE